MTVAQLGCFVAVAETGSFVEAGRRRGLTTSGVSKTITRMEATRGVRLLNRSPHSVSLTPEGERLLPMARAALDSVEEVDAALGAAASAGVGGRVRVGAPTAFLSAGLAPLLPRLRAAHPDVQLDLRGSDELVDLADEAVDFVLRAGALKGMPGHRSQLLFTFSWVTCAAPSYLAQRGEPRTPVDLDRHDLIGFRNQRTGLVDSWRYRSATGAGLRRQPKPAFVMDDANAGVTATVSGAGLIWAPRWLVSPALRAGTLTEVLASWAGEQTPMSVLRREGRAPDRVEQVITFLRQSRSSFS